MHPNLIWRLGEDFQEEMRSEPKPLREEGRVRIAFVRKQESMACPINGKSARLE